MWVSLAFASALTPDGYSNWGGPPFTQPPRQRSAPCNRGSTAGQPTPPARTTQFSGARTASSPDRLSPEGICGTRVVGLAPHSLDGLPPAAIMRDADGST